MNLSKMTQKEAAQHILNGQQEIEVKGSNDSGDILLHTVSFDDLMNCEFSVSYSDNHEFVCGGDVEFYAHYEFRDGSDLITHVVTYSK